MNNYFVLDARAGFLAIGNDGILDTEDNGKYILLVGTLEECCKAANRPDAILSVVSNDKYNILWECLNQCGHWSLKHLKNEHSKD
jgi:hypothetical protein